MLVSNNLVAIPCPTIVSGKYKTNELFKTKFKHQKYLAVLLFSLDTNFHKDNNITDWAPPKTGSNLYEMFWDKFPNGPLPALLPSVVH